MPKLTTHRVLIGLAALTVAIGTMPAFGSAFASGTAWTPLARTVSAHISGAAAAGSDGKIYLFGGRVPNSGNSSAASEAYTPASNTWATIAPMPTARWGIEAVRAAGGKIYVIGGRNSGGVRRKNEAYDPATNTWSTKAPMPIGGAFGAASLGSDGKIYVFGGYRKNYGVNGTGDLNAVQIYDPAADAWSVNHSMPVALISSAAALGSDHRIYFMGGYPNELAHGAASAWSYDPAGNKWGQIAPMSTIRTGFAAVGLSGGRIFAMAGQNIDSPLKSTEVYTIASNTWSGAASLPSARYDFSAASYAGTIYEIGGLDAGGAATKSVTSYSPR